MEEGKVRGGGLLPDKMSLLRGGVALQHTLKVLEELWDADLPKVLCAPKRLLLLVLVVQRPRDRVVHVVALIAQVERGERELAHDRTLLLRLLAPSLRTLSCVLFNPLQSAVFARLCAVPFPFLTDLTLRLSERILMPPPPAAPAMPRLRRLHFASSRYLSTTAAPVLALFAAACPLLARLRLSDLRLMPGCAAALCRMLGRDPVRDQYGWMPSAASLDRVARLPARVRAVVVQLEDLEAKGFGGFEAHLVQSVADADGADGFVLLPRAPRRTYEQWAEDWAAVAHGDYSAWEAVRA